MRVKITNPDGTSFHSCECVRAQWPDLQKVLVKRGLITSNLDVTQGSYNTSVNASAKTHAGGGVLDIRQTSAEIDTVLEEAGWASYVRGPVSYDSFSPHSHIILRSCPHLHWQAKNQVTAWHNMRDGLVRNWKDRDHTRPSVMRGLSAARDWLRLQLGAPIQKRTGIYGMGQGRPISFSWTMNALGKPNGNVKIIQTLLQAQRYDGNTKPYYPGSLDGIYGPTTRDAVARYQRAIGYRGAAADGYLGWASFSKLTSWGGWKPVR